MCVPVILLGQCFVDAIIEVFVVRKYDMSSDIIELGIPSQHLLWSSCCQLQRHGDVQNLQESHLSMRDHQGFRSNLLSSMMGRPTVTVS